MEDDIIIYEVEFWFLIQESLDNINLFSVITIISFILLVPSAILLEGVKFTPAYLHSAVSTSHLLIP